MRFRNFPRGLGVASTQEGEPFGRFPRRSPGAAGLSPQLRGLRGLRHRTCGRNLLTQQTTFGTQPPHRLAASRAHGGHSGHRTSRLINEATITHTECADGSQGSAHPHFTVQLNQRGSAPSGPPGGAPAWGSASGPCWENKNLSKKRSVHTTAVPDSNCFQSKRT